MHYYILYCTVKFVSGVSLLIIFCSIIYLFIYLASPNWNTIFIHECIKIIRQIDHYSLTNYSGSLVK